MPTVASRCRGIGGLHRRDATPASRGAGLLIEQARTSCRPRSPAEALRGHRKTSASSLPSEYGEEIALGSESELSFLLSPCPFRAYVTNHFVDMEMKAWTKSLSTQRASPQSSSAHAVGAISPATALQRGNSQHCTCGSVTSTSQGHAERSRLPAMRDTGSAAETSRGGPPPPAQGRSDVQIGQPDLPDARMGRRTTLAEA